jgi:hypothetical protein
MDMSYTARFDGKGSYLDLLAYDDALDSDPPMSLEVEAWLVGYEVSFFHGVYHSDPRRHYRRVGT